MVGEDLQVGQLVENPREDEARHGGGGLVRPAEGPPDLVARFRLALVVGDVVRAARGVQEDGLAVPRRRLEHGKELRLVKGLAVDVGVDLQPVGAVPESALRLLRGIGRVHRQGGEIADEIVGVAVDELRQAVIAEPGELFRNGRLAERLQRRHAEGDHLDVVLVPEEVDDATPLVEVVDGRHAAHAHADVPRRAVRREHAIPDRLREEVVEGVDVTHGQVSSLVAACRRRLGAGRRINVRSPRRRAGWARQELRCRARRYACPAAAG